MIIEETPPVARTGDPLRGRASAGSRLTGAAPVRDLHTGAGVRRASLTARHGSAILASWDFFFD